MGFPQDLRVARELVLRSIRQFFYSQGFLETDTPTLVLSPGMEPHIRPLSLADKKAYLPTSPEFAMKKILAQGYEKIFQICKAYRDEPESSTHHPEFTILEWYRLNSNYTEIMDDVEKLFIHIAAGLEKRFGIKSPWLGKPWPRFTIEECFRRFAEIELTSNLTAETLAQTCLERGWLTRENNRVESFSKPDVWDDLFFRVMMNAVEPALARLDTPVIIYNYPESQAALSNLFTDERGLRWAKRFEVYAGGYELGNAFDELCNAFVQRERFVKDMRLREQIYGNSFPPSPIDEEFLKAVDKIPPSGGIAMGVDRIVMYFTGAKNIEDVLWLKSFTEQKG